MRVISGKARGKRIVTLEGTDTRPTLDRVKEALFSKIQFELPDAEVLDLFAGSGALGIEALSRDAKRAIFCDSNYKAANIIKQNIENCKFEDSAIVINKDYLKALESLKNNQFDIIFLDPPYKTDFALISLEKIVEYNLIKDEGTIIVETNDGNKQNKIADIEGIEITDIRKYGNVILIFIRKG